jgi:outer membrane protein OmpA-like peptidoglycan-associated protein
MISLAVFFAVSAISHAETVNAKGIIKARSGAVLIVQTADQGDVRMLLTDSTKVGQVQGVLKVRHKEMSMAALIPGLPIQAEGTYDTEHQLVASSIKFKGDDLQQARSIQAGMHETQERSRENAESLKKQQEELTAQQQKIAANKEAVDAAIARFGQLDDYIIFDEVTILYANGKVKLEDKYKPDLTRLAEKAKTVQGYMVEVKGYASSAGSTVVNQKLSEERANGVATFLIQQGRIPLTNLLAPGAMGEFEQVGNADTAEGQAENRRVVVRVLQNKAIAGM